MSRRALEQLKENRNRGVSMAIVICVSAFFMAFAAAILYTTGLLTASTNQRLEEERCYRLAKTCDRVLKEELVKYDKKGNAPGSFFDFVNDFIDEKAYLEYNEEFSDTTKYRFLPKGTNLNQLSASPNGLDANYGNLRITLRKTKNANEAESLSGGTIPVSSGTGGDYSAQIEALKNQTVRAYNITVDVTAYLGEVSYTYSTEYVREEKYALTFSHDGNTIVWGEDGKWHVGNTSGSVYEPKQGEIQYTYLDETTSCRFLEYTYEEGGS